MKQAVGEVDQGRRRQETASRDQSATRAMAAGELSFNGAVSAAHV
jgi:hypothetical protein